MVQMDTRLPLMVQGPNVLAALDAGTTAASNQANVMRQAEGQNLFRQYGAGAMQGDANALNALAAFDPTMAQGMKADQLRMDATRQNMAFDREKMQMLRDEVARGLATAEDQAAAAREAAQMAQLAQAAVRAHAAGDEASFGALTAEAFGQALPFSPEGLAALAAADEGAKAYLGNLPKAPELTAEMRNLEWRAQQAGLKPGTPEYAQFMANGGRNDGMMIESDGQGGVRIGTGAAAANVKPFTEGQSKDNVYATRATGALAVLDSVGAEAMASRSGRLGDALSGATMGLSREMLQSEDYQVAKQAGDEFLQAILRKDTGAAITEGEQSLYGVTYLPQPGDGPRVLEAKRQSRIRAVEALKSGMSIQQITTVERALIESARQAEVGQPAAPAETAPQDSGNKTSTGVTWSIVE